MKIPTLRKGQAVIQLAWSTLALRDLANRNLNQPEKMQFRNITNTHCLELNAFLYSKFFRLS